ncbi:MAG: type II toxin-antitoxin system HicA family toxin [Planctomycetes bacterium]|nr:type II toxin-antitoxin system HicA family toxin [Planctomycetota bacterium]
MSLPLPVVSGREVVTALQRIGYYIRKQRGSHIRLYHPNRLPVTVPDHKELDRGTLKSILRTVNLTTEEFNNLL